MDEIRIEKSQSKLWLMFIGAMGFVTVGIWLLGLSPEQLSKYQRFNHSWLIMSVAWSSILFFGSCVLAMSRKKVDRSPSLAINAKGIHDATSAISIGLIHWSEITAIHERNIMGQRTVDILMPNYDKVVRGAGLFKRKMHEDNIRLCGSPVSISANSLKTNHANLRQLLQEQFVQHHAAAR